MSESPNTRSYLLCGTPRTGSTLLCGLLRATGVAGVPQSYFRLPDERSWAARWQLPLDRNGSFEYGDYVQAAVAAGSTDNGVFGARLMWGTLDQVVAKLGSVYPDLAGADLELLHHVFGPVDFLYLRRADAVAQAVSWVRAEQTQHWQDEDGSSPNAETHFDAAQIHECVRTIEKHNGAWRTWFAAFDIRPLSVTYEELVADMGHTTQAILEFLGLSSTLRQPIVPTHRQADELNDDWVARYRASARLG